MQKRTDSVGTFGSFIAVATSVVTFITFAIAVTTLPLSGPYCAVSCYVYPYYDIASRFPRDYLWMYPAMLLVVSYAMLFACIHRYAAGEKKTFSLIALSFSLISAAVFLIDYFTQVSVIQPSLLLGETDGIALFSQFNPHGMFIVLEELGFIAMGISFLFLVPVFTGTDGIERALRKIFVANAVLTVAAFVFYTLKFGVFREYRFEVAVISIQWLTLIVSGILLAKVFRRAV